MSAQARQNEPNETSPVEIDGRDYVYSVAFVANGEHVVSGGFEGKIRRWRVQDGQEVGTPMDAGSPVYNIAVSHDEKRIVAGTKDSLVSVWNVESHGKETEFKGHSNAVRAVDVSQDGSMFLSGSGDKTARVWSMNATGQKLPNPLRNDHWVIAAKFSPDGSLIATTVRERSFRVYDCQSGNLLRDNPIQVRSFHNQSLAWAGDSKRLFAVSVEGNVHCLDVSTGKMISKWSIQDKDAQCIVLAPNEKFIAVSAGQSVSFWDTETYERIGAVTHSTFISSLAISSNCDLAIAGGKRISVRSLCDVLPGPYSEKKERIIEDLPVQEKNSNGNIENVEKTAKELPNQQGESQGAANEKDKGIESAHADSELQGKASSDERTADLEKTIQQLRTANEEKDELIKSLRAQEQTLNERIKDFEKTTEQLRAANGEEDELIKSLRTQEQNSKEQIRNFESTLKQLRAENEEKDELIKSLRAQEQNSSENATRLEKAAEELRSELAELHRAAKEQDETIKSLHANLQEQKAGASNLERTIEQLRAANGEKDELIKSLRTQEQSSGDNTTHLKKAIDELRSELTGLHRAAKEQDETIKSLHTNLQGQRTGSGDLEKTIEQLRATNDMKDGLIMSLRTQEQNLSDNTTRLERVIEEFRTELAGSQRAAKEQEETIKSLQANIQGQKAGSKHLERAIQQLQSSNREKETLIKSLRAKEQDLKCKAEDLEKTVAELRHQLAESQRTIDEQNVATKSLTARLQTMETGSGDFERTIQQLRITSQEKDDLIKSLHTEKESLSGNTARLEKTVEEFRSQIMESQRAVDEQHEINESLRADLQAQRTSSANQEKALRDQLAISHQERDGFIAQLSESRHRTDDLTRIVRAHEQKHRCEVLYTQQRTLDAADSLLEMANTLSEDINSNGLLLDWLSDFTHRCVSALERVGDQASNVKKPDEAIVAYATALSLGPSTPASVLIKWTRAILARVSAEDALGAAAKFKTPRYLVYRAVCDALEEADRLAEADQFFRQMKDRVSEGGSDRDEQAQWESDFRTRCAAKSARLANDSTGDLDGKQHEDAVAVTRDASAPLLGSVGAKPVSSKQSDEARKGDDVTRHRRRLAVSPVTLLVVFSVLCLALSVFLAHRSGVISLAPGTMS